MMTFKDLKSGHTVYLLDRTALKYEEGLVTATSLPLPDMTPGNYGRMLIDITVQTKDGRRNTYAVNDSEQTAYAGSLLLSASKDSVANEVRAINAQAEETLAKVPDAQRTASVCKALLAELDTAYRDRQETEGRFRKIDERFGSMEAKMDRILEAMGRKADGE